MLNSGQNWQFFCPVWPWNLMDDLEKQQGTSSMLLQALCIISSHWWIQTRVTVRKRPIWVKFDDFLSRVTLEIWQMTLQNNRAPLLSNIKLYASFHYHMWIQTGVTVQKQLSWVMTSVTLTFDLWPWPFVWTSLLSMVINFMMIQWQEHSEKGVTDKQMDRQTDGQKEVFFELFGRS